MMMENSGENRVPTRRGPCTHGTPSACHAGIHASIREIFIAVFRVDIDDPKSVDEYRAGAQRERELYAALSKAASTTTSAITRGLIAAVAILLASQADYVLRVIGHVIGKGPPGN